MAKKVEIELDVKGNVVESVANLKKLKQSLKEIPAGTAEWSKVKNQIRDIEDGLKSAEQSSEDFLGQLEMAPGPLGQLGGMIKKVELSTKSFGAALKATGIGLIVAAIGGLVAAFSQSETAMKKLEPLWIGLEKILGGIMAAFEPLLDAFLEMALTALPYITKGIGIFYSSLLSLFTLVKEAGMGVGNILRGIFTLDFGAVTEGWNQLTGSWDKTVNQFTESMGRYEAGTKQMTKTEKENLKEGEDARKKAFDEKLKRMETEDKLDAAKLEKMKAEAMVLAQTEQEKLAVEKKFAELSYQNELKNIEDKQKLYKKDSDEYKNLEVEKLKLQANYITQTQGFADKEKELQEKKNKELEDAEINALNMRKAQGLIKEEEYQKALRDIKMKYAADDKSRKEAELAYEQYLTEQRKKRAEEERQILLMGVQDQIDAIDKKNEQYQFDFAQDLQRLEEKKLLLEKQKQEELNNSELTGAQRLEIEKKYAKLQEGVEKQITDTKQAEQDARIALQNQYLDIVGQFGGFLQQIAGKNKGLAKAGLIVEQAAGVAKIIVNTAAANAKAVAASPLTGGMPWVAINTATAALSIGSAIAATVKGIRQIDASDSGGAGGGGDTGGGQASAANLGQNYADGGMIGGRRHAQGGTMIEAEQGEAIMTRGAVSMFKPLLSLMNQAGGGVSFAPSLLTTRMDNPVVEDVSQQQQPPIFKTYVVEQELTNAQQRQARLKDLSTL